MFKKLLFLGVLYLSASHCLGQIVTECPQNIGFENGTLANWECYTGFISDTRRTVMNAIRPAVIALSPSKPIPGRHTVIPKGSMDGYGGFSLDAPNGSDYVIRLGNAVNGRGAESISYTLQVPSNVDAYSVIFNYAVVLENPNHEYDEQPKFTAKVIDLNTNTTTSCGSFEFTAPGSGGGIPGFQKSLQADSVLYKPWSPVMVNLSEYLGHTIRLEFTTNDCSRGGHFGYAYIDFNENCSIPIIGNVTCPDVGGITLKTITGLAGYNWFNAQTLESLGTSQFLSLSPVPPVGTKIGVELSPFPGLGCTQTLYTTITNMFMNIANPEEKCISVDITATSLTVGNSSDLTYTYWKDKNATVVLDNPKHVTIDGTYYIKGTSSSGCTLVLPVTVVIKKITSIKVLEPPVVSYPTTVDLTQSYISEPGFTYTYWTDPEATKSLKNPSKIRFSGVFYIKASTDEGCSTIEPITVTVILPDLSIPNTFTPNGDGINDVFTIMVSNKIQIKNFKVFNRWGDLMYQTADITQYWDGLKGDSKVPVGVYYWVLEGDEEMKFFKKSGWVTVIR